MEEIISDYSPEVDVKMLWTTWTLKQRLYWYWKVKLGFGIKEILRYLDIENFIISQFVDRDDEQKEILGEVLDSYEKHYFKWWYEMYPKTVILTNIKISPNKVTDYVLMNFTIGEEDSKNAD